MRGGVALERVTGDLLRMVPGADFPGVAPGQSVEIEYLTPLITNISFAPAGPYVVFDEAPDRGHAIDYVAVPFERPSQPGRDPRVVTPQAQYARDQAVRDIPLDGPAPGLPDSAVAPEAGGTAAARGVAGGVGAAGAQAEAAFAAEYLRPHVASRRCRRRRIFRRRPGSPRSTCARTSRRPPRRPPGRRGRRPCGSRPAPSRARPRPRPTSSSSTRSRASACAAPRPPASSTACSP